MRRTTLVSAAIILTAITALLWQFRFTQISPNLALSFEPGLKGWNWTDGQGQETAVPQTGLLRLQKSPQDKAISLDQNLGKLEGTRFLLLSAKAKWTDVRQVGEIRWSTARALICGEKPDGTKVWPKDHWLISAYDSKDWHHEEIVVDLPPNLGTVHFAIQHLGESGTLELQDLKIIAVHQRPSFLPLASILICLWTLWAAFLIRPLLHPHSRAAWLRTTLAAITCVAATMALVFPQPRFCARPLIGAFHLGPGIPQPPPPPKPAPALPTTPIPAPPTQNPTTPAPPPTPQQPVPAVVTTPPPAPKPAPPLPPESKKSHKTELAIRLFDERINILHFVAFASFSLALFLFSSFKSWPIAATIAFLSEAIPNWQLQQSWDLGDLGDLAADSLGILSAVFLIRLLSRLRRKPKPLPV